MRYREFLMVIFLALGVLVFSGCAGTPITECSPNGTRVVMVPDMQTGAFPMIEKCENN